jgi:hypothetical protein
MITQIRGSRASIARVAEMLRDLEMPSDDIREVLETDDREVVRRHFELQRELLEERLDEQRWVLIRLERLLTEAIFEPLSGAVYGSAASR